MINSGVILVLQEIFGLEEAKKEDDGEDDSKKCTICLTEEKNTIVVPCGHLCVCKGCATEFAKQKSPDCPICRQSKF